MMEDSVSLILRIKRLLKEKGITIIAPSSEFDISKYNRPLVSLEEVVPKEKEDIDIFLRLKKRKSCLGILKGKSRSKE